MKAIRFASVQSLITVSLALLIGLAVAASLSGCATTSMSQDEAKAHEAASVAQAKRAEADKAKSDAIATLAAGTGSAERVAGIMALVMSGQSAAQAPQVIQSRRSTTEVVIDGFLRFLGLGVQYHGIEAGKDVSIQASRDRAATDQAAFSALADVAGKIQAPQANQTTTTQTLSGPGVIGSGSYSAPTTTTSTELTWEVSTTTTDTTSTSSSNDTNTNSSYNSQN